MCTILHVGKWIAWERHKFACLVCASRHTCEIAFFGNQFNERKTKNCEIFSGFCWTPKLNYLCMFSAAAEQIRYTTIRARVTVCGELHEKFMETFFMRFSFQHIKKNILLPLDISRSRCAFEFFSSLSRSVSLLTWGNQPNEISRERSNSNWSTK